MALFSLHHSHIGKSTQTRPHTAAAHLRYITRSKACSAVLAGQMPDGGVSARRWIRAEEEADRKNARVVDKVMLALPLELTPVQRHALVREFAETLTEGRASWFAAFHDKDQDAHNPHCHLVLRDRDPDTGKRVMLTSEKGSTERMRLLWEVIQNRHLERHGHEVRVDRRTLEAQGVDAPAQQHVGPVAPAMAQRGERPSSRNRRRRNLKVSRFKSRHGDHRLAPYARIDQGRTRQDLRRETIEQRRRGLTRDETVRARRNRRHRRILQDPSLRTSETAPIHQELTLEVSAMTPLAIKDALLREMQKARAFDARLKRDQARQEDEIAKLAACLLEEPERLIVALQERAPDAIAAELVQTPTLFGRVRKSRVLADLPIPTSAQRRTLFGVLGSMIHARSDSQRLRETVGKMASAAVEGRKPDLSEGRRRELLAASGAHGAGAEQEYEDSFAKRSKERTALLETSPNLAAALEDQPVAWLEPETLPVQIREGYRLAKATLSGDERQVKRAQQARERLNRRRRARGLEQEV